MRGTRLLFAPMMLAIAAQVTFAKKQVDSPAQIAAKIEDKLYHAQVFKHGNVQVNVDNGVATLTGTVDCVGFNGFSPLGRSDILRASCCMLTRFATLGQFFARDYNNLPVR